MKTLQAEARQRRLYDHAALTLLGTDPLPEEDGLSPEEQEAVRELEKKYDAARDKLLIEVELFLLMGVHLNITDQMNLLSF